MSMTDTAEYWADVKRNYPYVGPDYYHIPNIDCGHRHLYEAKRLGDVNCRSCLKLIEEGLSHNLPEGKTISKYERKRLNAIKQLELKFGRCSKCGSLMTERVNKTTKEKFLGCTNYPNCKTTKTLK